MAVTRVISSAQASASQPRLDPSLGYWFDLHMRQRLIGGALRRIYQAKSDRFPPTIHSLRICGAARCPGPTSHMNPLLDPAITHCCVPKPHKSKMTRSIGGSAIKLIPMPPDWSLCCWKHLELVEICERERVTHENLNRLGRIMYAMQPEF